MAHASLSPHPDPARASSTSSAIRESVMSYSYCGELWLWRRRQRRLYMEEMARAKRYRSPSSSFDQPNAHLPCRRARDAASSISLSLCLRVSRGPGVEIRVEWKEVERKREHGWEGWWLRAATTARPVRGVVRPARSDPMRRGGRTLASFASAVGVEKFWVSFPLLCRNANHGMPIPFALTPLETA